MFLFPLKTVCRTCICIRFDDHRSGVLLLLLLLLPQQLLLSAWWVSLSLPSSSLFRFVLVRVWLCVCALCVQSQVSPSVVQIVRTYLVHRRCCPLFFARAYALMCVRSIRIKIRCNTVCHRSPSIPGNICFTVLLLVAAVDSFVFACVSTRWTYTSNDVQPHDDDDHHYELWIECDEMWNGFLSMFSFYLRRLIWNGRVIIPMSWVSESVGLWFIGYGNVRGIPNCVLSNST